MKLNRGSNIDDIFKFIAEEENHTCVILFVDQSPLCESYSKQSWLLQEGVQIVEVDQNIVDVLQIGKVPQFRFYVGATEVHDLIGTADYDIFLKRKAQLFAPVFKRDLKLSNIKAQPSVPEVEL